jgi:endonuclease/exonuclease/phosphatase family metal-dependent hydrolase
VIAGDLNLPRRVVQAALRGTGWHAARAGATFPGRRPVAQLDHVLVHSGRLIEMTTGPAYPSDHRVVCATIVLPTTDRPPHSADRRGNAIGYERCSGLG